MEEPLSFLKMILEQVDIHRKKKKKKENKTKQNVLETHLMILNLDHGH